MKSFDYTRLAIARLVHIAKDAEEKALAKALLFGYDNGELHVTTDPASGELQFSAALPN